MNLSKKQITFRKRLTIQQRLDEGIRALAEKYAGDRKLTTDHCIDRVLYLTDARLDRLHGPQTPNNTRDGQSFITLIWVLLVDGMLAYRKSDAVRAWLVDLIEATDLFEDRLTDEDLPALIELFQGMAFVGGVDVPSPQTITNTIGQVWAASVPSGGGGERPLPNLTRLFVGREEDVRRIQQRLGVGDRTRYQPLTIVRGWPGVGKTALINAIANSKSVQETFRDGLLWTSIGPHGDIFTVFQDWAKQLGAIHLLQHQKLPDLANGLRTVLAGRDLLIIADDVWTVEQGQYIRHVVDQANTLLLTTRFTDVANQLKVFPDDIYVLEPLSEAHAIELLTALAPDPVRMHQARIPQLVKVLEGLPLALRVAGPTLQYYHEMHFDIDRLIDEFENDYNRLLEAKAPADRFDEVTGQTPTIELLFKRSVETLTPEGQYAFAGLGVFKEKPATFNAEALEAVWEVSNPEPLISTLIGRGLMEAASDRRYRVHQTLHMYAQKLLDAYDDEDAAGDAPSSSS